MRRKSWTSAFVAGALLALASPSWGQAPPGSGRPAPGVWRVGGDGAVTVFAEQSAVGPGQGGAVRMPSVWVLRTPEPTPRGRMKYFMATYEYDCATSRLRLVRIATYNANGDVLEPDLGGTGFQEAQPASINETMLRTACAPFAAWPQLGAQRISGEGRSAVELVIYADIEFENSAANPH